MAIVAGSAEARPPETAAIAIPVTGRSIEKNDFIPKLLLWRLGRAVQLHKEDRIMIAVASLFSQTLSHTSPAPSSPSSPGGAGDPPATSECRLDGGVQKEET
jgi:hypothetical protein